MDLSENVRVFVRICLQRATLSKLDPKMRASDWKGIQWGAAIKILFWKQQGCVLHIVLGLGRKDADIYRCA